jgi:hypothetical protein
VNKLNDTYRRLAVPWTHEQLAAHYRAAEHHGGNSARRDPEPTRPIPLLAAAIAPSTTLSVAIHMLHALPSTTESRLPAQLLEAARRNTADALYRCQRALERDGATHGYNVQEWLPVVFDIAAPQLESARAGTEPPTVVQQTQEAISWLSRALVELDADSTEVPSALCEVLARLLLVWVFVELASDGSRSD